MKIEINPEFLAHKLAMHKVEKKYNDQNIDPYNHTCDEYVGCTCIGPAQDDFDKHKNIYLKLILDEKI